MRFLVLQHHRDEHPGVLRDFMAEDGAVWDAVELDAGEPIPADISGYDALISMGGPMDVWETEEHPWLDDEKTLIREAVGERGMPFLGVCLGHQLLADALGGKVVKMDTPEVGICPVEFNKAGQADVLTGRLAAEIECLQWHGVSVIEPPAGGVSLAHSPVCPVQAMRVGGRAWGVQFHVEMTEATVREWAAIPVYRRALENVLGEGGAEKLEAEAAARLARFNQDACALYEGFMAGVKG